MKRRKSLFRRLFLALLCVGLLTTVGCPKDDDDDPPPPPDPTASLVWSASTLSTQIANNAVVVLDCRKDIADATGQMYTPYDTEHITGSYYFDFFLFGDPYAPSPPTAAIARLEALGITTSTTICLYDAGIANPQGKVFFNLERLGCTNVHILDGGFPVWQGVSGSTSTTATTLPTSSTFTPVYDNTIQYDLSDMLTAYTAVNGGDTSIAIIDYREAPLYWGHKICPDAARHGCIPGSTLLDWHDYFDSSTNLFQPASIIESLTVAAGGSPSKTNIVLCNKGWRSGLAYFALRYAGWPKSSLRHYVGGIREWAAGSSTTYPMDTEGCYTYDAGEKMPPGTGAARRFAGAFTQVGTDVYCIGGYTANTTGGVHSALNQCFDMAALSSCWTDLTSMPAARGFCAAGTDGTDVFVFGGLDSTDTVTGSVYMYDVSTNLWTTVSTSDAEATRFSFAATNVGTAIYLGGGLTATSGAVTANYSSEFWEYETTTDTWTAMPALPGAHGRRCHSLVTIGTNVYLVGGYYYDDTLTGTDAKVDLSDVWVIDVNAGTPAWTQLASMPGDLAGHAAAVVNGDIYVPGGFTVEGLKADVYEFDVSAGTWSTLMKNSRSALCAWPRFWYFIGASGNRMAVIGGYSQSSANTNTAQNTGKTHFNQAYVYDVTLPD